VRVEIDLLGGFDVRVDGRGVPADTWRQRRGAAALVKLLALAPRRRLTRDRVLAALWPGAGPGGRTAAAAHRGA
jgi:DNA-binding SARP family transcriptional activator